MAQTLPKNSKPKRRKRTFRLMPITSTMLALLLIIKVNELYIGSRQLKEFYGVREAAASDKKEEAPAADAKPEEKPADAKADAKPDEKTADAKDTAVKEGEIKEGDKAEEKPAEGEHAAESEGGHGDGKKESGYKKDKPIPGVNRTYGTAKTDLSEIEALKAKESVPRFTQNEIDLLENLSKRRDELDQREKDLVIKSKVLEATEKRINDKLSEMKTLQSDLTKVVAQYNDKQDSQIKGLVKIYENMKPGDAANIFNEMDMPILLEVINKMSERKVAPVLAAMSPSKARDVTQELAAMRKSMAKANGVGN